MLKSIKRLLNSSISGLESTGESVGKYLKVMDVHSDSWVKEAVREAAMEEKESVAKMAQRMQELADDLAKLDPAVVVETEAMIREAYEQAGI